MSAPTVETPGPATRSDGTGRAATRPVRTPAGVFVLRLLGLVGVLVLVGGGAASLVVGFFETGREQTGSFTARVEVVDVDSDVGRVTVRVGDPGSATTVTTRQRWSVTEPRVSSSVAGRTATLRGRCDGGWFLLGRCSVSYDLTVPPGTVLRLTTTTGSIDVVGADADITARTATGSIEMSALRAGRVTADAATGSVVLRFAKAPTEVRARAATGSVEVRVPDDGATYRLTASSAVGGRQVLVPQDPRSSRVIDATTAVGSVVVATTGAQVPG